MRRGAQTMACSPHPQGDPLCASLPSIIFHHAPVARLDRLPLKDKILALVPAPGLLVLAGAAQPDFVRQELPREGKQLPPHRAALTTGRDEQLVEIFPRHM